MSIPKWLAAAVLVVGGLGGCKPDTCAPGPFPDRYKQVVGFLPKSAVICGEENGRLHVEFTSGEPKQLLHETHLAIGETGWRIERSSTETGDLHARSPAAALHISIVKPRGGPYAGKIVSTVSLIDVPPK